ncbi:putative membrane protein [Archangium gephyra]|uniref:Membrane protein n=1 Tax=Archangium gephyra TaxID=48 RepID=A0AAC8QAQ8_9BACT|nr:putative membrane protein [Archangium gephyra]
MPQLFHLTLDHNFSKVGRVRVEVVGLDFPKRARGQLQRVEVLPIHEHVPAGETVVRNSVGALVMQFISTKMALRRDGLAPAALSFRDAGWPHRREIRPFWPRLGPFFRRGFLRGGRCFRARKPPERRTAPRLSRAASPLAGGWRAWGPGPLALLGLAVSSYRLRERAEVRCTLGDAWPGPPLELGLGGSWRGRSEYDGAPQQPRTHARGAARGQISAPKHSRRLRGKGAILLGVSHRPARVRFPPSPIEVSRRREARPQQPGVVSPAGGSGRGGGGEVAPRGRADGAIDPVPQQLAHSRARHRVIGGGQGGQRRDAPGECSVPLQGHAEGAQIRDRGRLFARHDVDPIGRAGRIGLINSQQEHGFRVGRPGKGSGSRHIRRLIRWRERAGRLREGQRHAAGVGCQSRLHNRRGSTFAECLQDEREAGLRYHGHRVAESGAGGRITEQANLGVRRKREAQLLALEGIAAREGDGPREGGMGHAAHQDVLTGSGGSITEAHVLAPPKARVARGDRCRSRPHGLQRIERAGGDGRTCPLHLRRVGGPGRGDGDEELGGYRADLRRGEQHDVVSRGRLATGEAPLQGPRARSQRKGSEESERDVLTRKPLVDRGDPRAIGQNGDVIGGLHSRETEGA